MKKSLLTHSIRFHKLNLSLLVAILISFLLLSVQRLHICVGIEVNQSFYESQFNSIPQDPSSGDSSWQKVPNERLPERLQFLVDQQNGNYERIRTWSGIYEQVRSIKLSPPSETEYKPVIKDDTEKVTSLSSTLLEDVYRFFRDSRGNKTYFSFDLKKETVYDKKGTVLRGENNIGQSNLVGIITPNENITYARDVNYSTPAVISTPTTASIKMCSILPPKTLQLSDCGTYLDPRAFFCPIVEPQTKRWTELEDFILPNLNGENGEEARSFQLDAIELYEKESNGVTWFWLNVGKSNVKNQYVFSSDSGFNIVYQALIDNDKTINTINLEYQKKNDVYIPRVMFLRYTTRRNQEDDVTEPNNFRFLKLIDAKINEKIPSKQFTLDALDLDEDVLIQNAIDETYYHYKDGRLVPFVKFDSPELITPRTEIWRSPVRMIALGLGIMLIILAVVFKTRHKQVETT